MPRTFLQSTGTLHIWPCFSSIEPKIIQNQVIVIKLQILFCRCQNETLRQCPALFKLHSLSMDAGMRHNPKAMIIKLQSVSYLDIRIHITPFLRLRFCRVCGRGKTVESEIARVESVGGWISDDRVCDILAVSRAFGDSQFKGPGLQELLAYGIE